MFIYQMSCKTISIDIQPITNYQISIVEEDWTETPISYVEYETILQPMTEHDISINQKTGMVEIWIKPEFMLSEIPEIKYGFQYCVSYRDPNLPEWIVARWYWNDEWLWFADGVWRDR